MDEAAVYARQIGRARAMAAAPLLALPSARSPDLKYTYGEFPENLHFYLFYYILLHFITLYYILLHPIAILFSVLS